MGRPRWVRPARRDRRTYVPPPLLARRRLLCRCRCWSAAAVGPPPLLVRRRCWSTATVGPPPLRGSVAPPLRVSRPTSARSATPPHHERDTTLVLSPPDQYQVALVGSWRNRRQRVGAAAAGLLASGCAAGRARSAGKGRSHRQLGPRTSTRPRPEHADTGRERFAVPSRPPVAGAPAQTGEAPHAGTGRPAAPRPARARPRVRLRQLAEAGAARPGPRPGRDRARARARRPGALATLLAADPAAATGRSTGWRRCSSCCAARPRTGRRPRVRPAAARRGRRPGQPHRRVGRRGAAWTALFDAVERRDLTLARLLARARRRAATRTPSTTPASSRTPRFLDLLYQPGFERLVRHKLDFEDSAGLRWFLDHGVDVNAERCLHQAIGRGRGLTILTLLLDAGADSNLPLGPLGRRPPPARAGRPLRAPRRLRPARRARRHRRPRPGRRGGAGVARGESVRCPRRRRRRWASRTPTATAGSSASSRCSAAPTWCGRCWTPAWPSTPAAGATSPRWTRPPCTAAPRPYGCSIERGADLTTARSTRRARPPGLRPLGPAQQPRRRRRLPRNGRGAARRRCADPARHRPAMRRSTRCWPVHIECKPIAKSPVSAWGYEGDQGLYEGRQRRRQVRGVGDGRRRSRGGAKDGGATGTPLD